MENIEEMEKIITRIKEMDGEKLNEATTIQTIINPILLYCGWNISNSKEVLQQPSNNKNGVPDITVENENGIFFYIEAKKFDEKSLQKHRKQGFSYCYAKGVSKLIITNGKQWDFYEPFHSNKSEEKRLYLSINIISETATKIIQKFNQVLKKSNYENGTIDQIIQNLFEKTNEIDEIDLIKVTNQYFKKNDFFENESLLSNIKNHYEKNTKLKIELDEIKEIIKSNFEIKKILKKKSQGFNIRNTRTELRDDLVEKIIKAVHERDPEETVRTRDGEISFIPGSVEVGFFIRVDVMRREKKVKFQIIIKKEGVNKHRKLVKILQSIKNQTGMELIESNTESRRSQTKNYTFDHILFLTSKESMEKIKGKVIRFLLVLNIIRKEIIEDFMIDYNL